MRFSGFVDRVAGRGYGAWDIFVRARERATAGEPVINLAVGDPDADTPEAAVHAAKRSLDAGETHYTPLLGTPALRRAVAAWHEHLTGHAVAPANVAATAGAQNALYAAAMCLVEPGREVLVPEPMYATYEAVIGAAGAHVVPVPLDPAAGFRLDPDALAARVTPHTDAILLNTPHNPTGAVVDRETMGAVAALCREHDLNLISDEVYAALTFEQPHVSPVAFDGMADRTAVVGSVSKSHAMAGWRLGWLIGPEALMAHVQSLLLATQYGRPAPTMAAAEAALTHGRDAARDMRDTLWRRRDTLVAGLDGVPGLTVRAPESGMFVLVDVRATGVPPDAFARRLLDARDVAVLPCDPFGPSAAGHVRVGLVAPDASLRTAAARMAEHAREIRTAMGQS